MGYEDNIKNGEENYVLNMLATGKYGHSVWDYYYRHTNGELFESHDLQHLDECRAARDKWLAEKGGNTKVDRELQMLLLSLTPSQKEKLVRYLKAEQVK